MRLIILRHAKSSRSDAGLSDHDRPLNLRGENDAPLVAKSLQDIGWVPEQVLSSNSERTRQTWARMADVLGHVPADFIPGLYLASAQQAIGELQVNADDVTTLLLLGHNPGLEQLVFDLSGRSERLTTCNAALLTSNARDWKRALSGRWTLEEVVRPKGLRTP
ncbi:MAG: phosphohistidine phosphatase [Cognaticolwellia sp.]